MCASAAAEVVTVYVCKCMRLSVCECVVAEPSNCMRVCLRLRLYACGVYERRSAERRVDVCVRPSAHREAKSNTEPLSATDVLVSWRTGVLLAACAPGREREREIESKRSAEREHRALSKCDAGVPAVENK